MSNPASNDHTDQPNTLFTRLKKACFIRNMTIRKRLILFVGLLVALTFLVSTFSYLRNHKAVTYIDKTHTLRVPTALVSASARVNLLKMRSSIHNYLMLGDPQYREDYEEARRAFEQDIAHMESLAPSWTNPANTERLDQIQKTFERWSPLPDKMFALRDNPLQNQPALRIMSEEGNPLVQVILRNAETMVLQQSRREATPENLILIKTIADFQNSFAIMVSHMRSYITTQNADIRDTLRPQQLANLIHWKKLLSQRDNLTTTQQSLLDSIETNKEAFGPIEQQIIETIESEHAYEDRYLFRNQALPLAEHMIQLLDEMITDQQNLLQQDLTTGKNDITIAQWLTLIGGGIVLFFGLLVAFLFDQSIAGPIERLTTTVEHMNAGDLQARTDIESHDEIGTLARAFNTMTRNLGVSQKKLVGYNYTLEQQVAQRTSELAEAVKKAEEAQKTAEQANHSKSQFLANMSHELRTPLNAIIGYSEILKEDAEDVGYSDFVADLDKIHASGRHLLSLINDILDISKIEAGKMELYLEDIDIASLMQQVVNTITPLLTQNENHLELIVDDKVGTMYTDVTKVQQILVNLLSNANKFTKHGTITMAVRHISQAQKTQSPIYYGSQSSDEWILFYVRDTGIGIAPDQIGHLFQAFTQADSSTTRKYGGTGLGLTITYHYCLMMGGNIHVESIPDVGSTFTVSLPVVVPKDTRDFDRTRDEQHSPTTAQSPSPPTTARDDTPTSYGTVLVIDDDPVARDIIARHLQKEPLHILTAENGIDGLQQAKTARPDVITLDVMMPNMDGWTVLAALKTDPELADIPVIMLTFIDEHEIGFTLGASDYLVKPIDWERLTSMVRKYHPDSNIVTEADAGYILVVEDDDATRELLHRSLEKEGWSVVEAENGRIAMDYIAEQHPKLLILDLMMPEMDGFQVITALQRDSIYRTIPVIVVTAMELTAQERQFLDGSVARILQKGGYNKEGLFEEVRNLILSCVRKH